MRKLFLPIGLAVILIGCKKEPAPEVYTIRGRLLDNCGSEVPMANKPLYFLVDKDAEEEDRVGRTDGNGNFEYSFEGPPDYQSEIGGTVATTAGQLFLCGITSSAPQVMDVGTIRVIIEEIVDLKVRVKGSTFSEQDTFFFSSFRSPSLTHLNSWYNGPFDPELVLDRNWTKYASQSDGTMAGYNDTPKPKILRLDGTFGISFYWQLSRNGQAGPVHEEVVLMDACTDEALIEIDLDSA